LLYDAVHLLYAAHDLDVENDEDGFVFTYVRTSILSASLLFECGANCCLDSLNLSGGFSDDLDKLSFLSKYEFFLNRIGRSAKFDRGCSEVQAVAEIKTIRDSYVHPKVRKAPLEKVAANVWDSDFGATKLLQLPRKSALWSPVHAVRVLSAANSFFNLFFLSWCEFDTDTVCEILLGSDVASVPAASSSQIDCIGGLDRAVRTWGIDFRFVGKNVS
jgi:hypothetical protein